MPFWRLCTAKRHFCCAQPPKCRAHNLDHRTNPSNSGRSGFKFRIKFGCAFGDEKDDHHFVRVKVLKMNAFIPHVMPGTPPNQASMISMLIAAAREKSAVFMHFVNDDDNKLEIDDDDTNEDFMVLEDWFGLQMSPAAATITNINHVAPAVPRFTMAKFPRMKLEVGQDTWHRN